MRVLRWVEEGLRMYGLGWVGIAALVQGGGKIAGTVVW